MPYGESDRERSERIAAEHLAEWDDRIDGWLEDARGVHDTMKRMHRDQLAAEQGIPFEPPAALPSRPQTGGAPSATTPGAPQPALASGRLVLVLPRVRTPLILEVTCRDGAGTRVVLGRVLQPDAGPPPPLILDHLPPGEYAARLLAPVSGAKTPLSGNAVQLDLRPRGQG